MSYLELYAQIVNIYSITLISITQHFISRYFEYIDTILEKTKENTFYDSLRNYLHGYEHNLYSMWNKIPGLYSRMLLLRKLLLLR
jgi:hypothetical protein